MSTKYCKCTMVMKFLYKENKVFQYFIVADTKYKKYALDNRFLLNGRLEEFIEKNALSLIDDRYTFICRRNEEDRITLEFQCPDEKIEKKPTGYFAIVGDIPCSEGCEECKFRNCMYCAKKDKEIGSMLKKCKFFSQSSGNKINENRERQC